MQEAPDRLGAIRGGRRWHGRPEARPDCDTCVWYLELFRQAPDWGVCTNASSERAGLLTHREQGCWQYEPMDERHYQPARTARCDFVRKFEEYRRQEGAAFIKEQVKRANDPSPEKEPPAPTSVQVRKTPLFVVIRRLLRHSDEDFTRPAFDAMAARARRDTRRYWDFARCYWSRTVGQEPTAIRLPENMRELENQFWRRVDAAISEALKGSGVGREKMTTRAKAEPRVGIFWLFGGKLITDSTPLSQAEPYGEAKTHPRGHLKHWTELQKTGQVPQDVEYEDPPRGRVLYYPRGEEFVLYADRCILAKKKLVRQIMAALNLPGKRTTTSKDSHYCCARCLRRGFEFDPD